MLALMAEPSMKNVLGEPLEYCSIKPMTGFTRNGSCETGLEDAGNHTVCVQVRQREQCEHYGAG